MTLDTVNVIEYVDCSIFNIRSFTDNEIGNREAEILFYDCIKENDKDALDEAIEEGITDGYYIDDTYEIYLAHSC